MDYAAEYDKQDANKLALAAQRMSMQQQQQQLADAQDTRNALQRAYSTAGGDQNALIKALQSDPRTAQQGMALQKSSTDIAESQAKTGNYASETAKRDYEVRRQKADQALKDIAALQSPEEAAASLERHAAAGDIDANTAARVRASIPSDPAQFGAWQLSTLKNILSAKDRLEMDQRKQIADEQNATHVTTTKMNNDTSMRNTDASNATSRANNSATVGATLRGQNMSDARAREAFNTPQYMETSDGLVALPKKLAPGQAPVGTPVMGANGQPLTKPLKDVPAAVAGKIIETKQSLNNIDQAIKAVQANPGAFDVFNAIPGVERMRQGDSAGVDARAQVANIGSLKLHDRSGAAVSASEFPRLAPFIPSSSDSPKAIVTKLAQMKRIAEEELGLYAEQYGQGSGYKPVARSAPAASGWSVKEVR